MPLCQIFFMCRHLHWNLHLSVNIIIHFTYSIEAAVQAFAVARPPGIYKEDYLQELFRRYGDIDDTPAAPMLPDWCEGETLNRA